MSHKKIQTHLHNPDDAEFTCQQQASAQTSAYINPPAILNLSE